MNSDLHILYADNNQTKAGEVEDVLAADGLACEIRHVGTGDEFLAALARGSVDLILFDFPPSCGDGLSAGTLARAKCPDAPLILLASTLSADLLAVGVEHGAADYVLKDQLVRLPFAVRRALQEGEKQAERRRGQRFQAVEQSVMRLLAEADTGDHVMPKILKLICMSMGWEVGMFWQLDEHTQMLRFSDVWHEPTVSLTAFETLSRSTPLPCGQGLPGQVWVTGEPTWIADASTSTNFPRTFAAEQDALRGGFAFPIRCRETVIGVVELFSRELGTPEPGQTQLMGALGCLIGLFMKRRRAEEALRDSEARFRLLIEHAHEVFWMTDAKNNRVLYVSPQFERLWGRPASSLYASPRLWLDGIHPEDQGRILEAAETNLVAGEYEQVYRVVKPNSAICRIHHWAIPFRDTSGQVDRVVWIAEELTPSAGRVSCQLSEAVG